VVAGMAVAAFLYSLTYIFRQIVIGYDTEDYEQARMGKLMKRALVLDVKAMVAAYLIAAPITYVLRRDALAAALTLTIALIVGRIPPLAVYTRYLRHRTGVLPVGESMATIAGTMMALAYSVSSGAWLIRVEEIWRDVLTLLPHLAAIGLLYVATFVALSSEARSLARNLLSKA